MRLVLLYVLLMMCSPAFATENLVGVFRWDNWFAGSPHEKVLNHSPPDRIPFFDVSTQMKRILLGGAPDVIDAENAYAFSAGIDYWVFAYYTDTGSFGRTASSMAGLNAALQSFMSIEDRRGMRFVVQLNQSSPPEDLLPLSHRLAAFVQDRDYLRLSDGSAPLFVYQIDQWEKSLGTPEKVLSFFAELQQKIEAEAGIRASLVLVGGTLQNAQNYIQPGSPFFIFASYVNAPGFHNQEHTYLDCMEISRRFWQSAVDARVSYIPTMTIGWDYRPVLRYPDQLFGRPSTPDWCRPTEPTEWEAITRSALEVSPRSTSGSPLSGILIYAWNELTEGGWLVPTETEGLRRLSILSHVLEKKRLPRPIQFKFPKRSYHWPCPLGLTLAGDREINAPLSLKQDNSEMWVERSCR